MVETHDQLSVFSILIGGWLLLRSDKASLRPKLTGEQIDQLVGFIREIGKQK